MNDKMQGGRIYSKFNSTHVVTSLAVNVEQMTWIITHGHEAHHVTTLKV